MKKFALAVLFSLAGLAGFGELAGLPGVTKHKYIEPGTYVSTDTWMTVSGRVEGVANKAAKKYASTSCARILPPYLHEVSFDDVYPNDAAWFYQQVGHAYTGHCSARRNGNVLERNFDWKFNEAPTFVIRISAAAGRFASLGVATIGDLVTEGQVNSHQWFPYFRCLPGHTVDGVNERGVVCEVNVTDGTWPRTEGEIHGLGAVRWALDNGTNAQQVAEYLADHVYLPEGFGGNLHWIVADATSTYIVEDGEAIPMTEQPVVMTNFSQDRTGGEGYERWASLTNLATTIESQWWTKAYDRDTRPIRLTDLGPDYEQIWTYWAQYPKELHRNQKIGGISWWQTVHCSKYDISGKALVIAVQEQAQWYRFALQTGGGGGGVDTNAVREIAREEIAPATNVIEAQIAALQDGKRGLDDLKVYGESLSEWKHPPASEVLPPGWSFVGSPSWYFDGDINEWHLFIEVMNESGIYISFDASDYDEFVKVLNVGSVDLPGYMFRCWRDVSFTPTDDHLAKESQLAQKRDRTDGDFTGTTIFFGINTVKGVEISGSNGPGRIRVGWETGETSIDINASYSMEPEVTIGKSGFATGTLSVESLNGESASIKKDGKEVATEEQLDEKVDANLDFVKIGKNAVAATNFTVAVGRGARAMYNGDCALGYDARAEGHGLPALALGVAAMATNNGSIAIGRLSRSHGPNTFNVTHGIGSWYAGDTPVVAAMQLHYSPTQVVEIVTNPAPSTLSFHALAETVITNTYTAYVPDGGHMAYADRGSLAEMLVDAATNADEKCECISTNICKLIQPELNRTVNANLNTYIDGETCVEYVGKFYDGSLYYVPTGNVYPPNN